MKKLLIVLSLLMVLMVSPMAMADTVTLQSGFGPYQTGQGGEFTMAPSDGLEWVLNAGYVEGVTKNVIVGNLQNFQTFCLEGSESIFASSTYKAVLNARAINGGVGPVGDPLSIGAAWLYHEFQIAGDFDGLATYVYTNPGRSGAAGSSADFLQLAFWWLEDEKSIAFNAANPFMAAVVTKFGSQAGAKADNNWAYPVAVLNLYDPRTGANAQDVLVCVPEPATMLLLGFGLIGLAGFAGRKFRK